MKKYSKDEAKNLTEKLVEFYEENKSKIQVDETMIRSRFIDLLFTYLNWDMYNQNQRPLTEQFVYEEERITVNGNKKRTDYTFCQGNGGLQNRAFFVEAKPPKTNIDKEFEPVFQLRRYGWSAGLYISVLTNFENFAIYNTKNIQPAKTDLPNIGRLDFFKYTDFVARFDELWELFEFENVQAGSIIEYAKRKGIISEIYVKGEKTVDNAFLMQIENWRADLAKDIVLRAKNKGVSSDKEKLNYAVQKIIDRIIFLRIIEDRGLEAEETLLKAAENYQTLCELFDYADDKYNSGLFHFTEEIGRGIPDTITKDLYIYEAVIKDIITPLYEGNPYAFDVMPAYILGSVYERFLGKEIDLSGNTVKIDEKPEVRKAGGVYYTPEYIVQYIVENTVSKNTDVKILDPACGSGSFLLVAYQFMLDFYQKKKPHSLLTLQERKQILLDHIYGVDVDEQAVEVARLSLLLKVLEGISKKEIDKLKKKEYILPSLHENIKCGNSLIDDVTVAGEKAFVWEQEFSTVFAKGGFDCVIGNPPYNEISEKKLKNYYQKNYKEVLAGHYDLYMFFIKKGIDLLRNKGRLSFITSHTFTVYNQFENLRKFILEKGSIVEITNRIEGVFEQAVVDNSIFIFRNNNYKLPTKFITHKCDGSKLRKISVKILERNEYDYTSFDIKTIENKKALEKHYINSKLLSEIVDSSQGITVYAKLQGEKINYFRNKKVSKFSKPITRGREISKYLNNWSGEFIEYGNWLWCPRNEKYFENPKIFLRQTSASIIATYIENPMYCIDSVHSLIQKDKKFDLKYILGILNSKLGNYFYHLLISEKGKVFAQVKLIFLRQIPIKIATKKQQNQIIKLVEKILELKKEGKRTERFENEIDEIVYELYGLSDAEIGAVEGKR